MNKNKRIKELTGLISNHDCRLSEGECLCIYWKDELEKLEKRTKINS